MNRDDVLIERVADGRSAGERWRVSSATCAVAVLDDKPAAIDAALARIEGTRGQLYIRDDPDEEPARFNPAGA